MFTVIMIYKQVTVIWENTIPPKKSHRNDDKSMWEIPKSRCKTRSEVSHPFSKSWRPFNNKDLKSIVFSEQGIVLFFINKLLNYCESTLLAGEYIG